MELAKIEIDKETEKWKTAVVLYVIGALPTIASLERSLLVNGLSPPNLRYIIIMVGIVLKCTCFDDRNESLCAAPQMLNASLLYQNMDP